MNVLSCKRTELTLTHMSIQTYSDEIRDLNRDDLPTLSPRIQHSINLHAPKIIKYVGSQSWHAFPDDVKRGLIIHALQKASLDATIAHPT